jgi:hypothetical protein
MYVWQGLSLRFRPLGVAPLSGAGLLGIIEKPYSMTQLKETIYPLFDP